MNARRRAVILAGIASFCFLSGVAVALTGGLVAHLSGIAISSRRVVPWWLAGGAAAFLAIRTAPEVFARATDRLGAALDRRAALAAAAISGTTLVVAIGFGAFTAAGSDPYGYITQASLWASGHLVQEQDAIAARAPWPNAAWSFAPLGYRPGSRPGDIVPTYPPGLPLLMAGATLVAGSAAKFFVVPILGAACIFLTFVLGWRLSGPRPSLAAALLLACSPVFLFQLVQPMSDVPVTALWLASLVLADIGSTGAAAAAGIAVSLAVLVRPNLVPLALPVGCYVATVREPGWRRAFAFAASAAAGIVAVAVINDALYGSPLKSGYGQLSEVYSLGNAGRNLILYPTWLLQTYSPIIFAGVAAPLVVVGLKNGSRARAMAWLTLAFGLVLFGCYLFYVPFDHWTYLRFLLPAAPLWILFTVIAVDRATMLASARWQPPLAIFVISLLAVSYVHTAVRADTFRLRTMFHQSYEEVAAAVARATPSNGVFFSLLQSGSLRLYANRSTIRYDLIDKDWLDKAVAFVTAAGCEPYAALDWTEESSFRQRFAGTATLERMRSPVLTAGDPSRPVRIYQLR